MKNIMDKPSLEIEQIRAEISRINADTMRLQSVPTKIAAEVDAMREENKLRWIKHEAEQKRYDEERKIRMAKQEVEIKKMNREIFWYPIAMLGGASILTAVITVLLTKALLH